MSERTEMEKRAAQAASLSTLAALGPCLPGVIGFDLCQDLRKLGYIETAKGGARVQITAKGRDALDAWRSSIAKQRKA